MIQIRNNMFETNSSSCHVFMFPKDMGIHIPSTVTLDDDYDTVDNMPNLFFNDSNWGENYATEFIKFLYKSGVKTIKYSGKHKYVNEAIEKYKDKTDFELHLRRTVGMTEHELKKICFGTDVHLTTMEDYMVCQEEIDKIGDFEDWNSYRLS